MKFEIPGKTIPPLYICRATLKHILEESESNANQYSYAELYFEFKERCRGRLDYGKSLFLISQWDITRLRYEYSESCGDEPGIQLRGYFDTKHVLTWDYLSQCEDVASDTYQVIKPQIINDNNDNIDN